MEGSEATRRVERDATGYTRWDGEALGNRTMCGGGGKHKKGDVARSEKNNEVSTGRGAR